MNCVRNFVGKPNRLGSLLLLLLIFASFVALESGATGFGIRAWWREPNPAHAELIQTVLTTIRMPRVLMSALAGATLGLAGAVMQGFLRNPLADPGLLGVSSGAALAAAIAIVCGGSLPFLMWLGSWRVPVSGMMGSAFVTSILYVIARRKGETSISTLLLAGIAISAFAGALTGLLTYSADDKALRDLTFWLMGSFAGTTWVRLGIVAIFLIPTFALTFFLSTSLNALMLGEADAMLMGYPVERTKRLCLFVTAASVGPVVAMVGAISFVGVVVPHLVRLFSGPDHRYLLPYSALLGAILLECADMLARTLVSPAEMPVGILTALIGTPVFMWLLMRNTAHVTL